MWYFVYNLALILLFVMILPLLPLVVLLGYRYRAGLSQRFGFYPKSVRETLAAARPVWIHAASVGEVRSAEPLVRELKKRAPQRKVVLSTFTATGNRIARQVPGVDTAIYLPLDFPWVVTRALRALNPAILVIIETEIWPNLLRAAFHRGIPCVLLSGRISEKAFARYSMFRAFFRRVLAFFSMLGMQSPADAARAAELGVENGKLSVVGNLKFASRSSDGWRRILSVRDPSRQLLVAGSSHRGEEEMLLNALKSARTRFPQLSLVLAPRHPERFDEVEKLLTNSRLVFRRKSRTVAEEYFGADVLLLDTVGELPEFFAAADIAFVGGSLVDHGGHNLLEPARFEKPILFGPYMSNFKTIAEEMKRRGAAIEVRNAADLRQALMNLLDDAEARRRMGECACQIAGANRDALTLNLKLAERYL
ncbi:MAG TPA: 3-deoxy-D-manno-octulosonic acid transferase [Candidatus Binatia bacterium]|nr:3-deoxy-D-manno-octulosonic acid transferase [Candidatus Binatia bacterium]